MWPVRLPAVQLRRRLKRPPWPQQSPGGPCEGPARHAAAPDLAGVAGSWWRSRTGGRCRRCQSCAATWTGTARWRAGWRPAGLPPAARGTHQLQAEKKRGRGGGVRGRPGVTQRFLLSQLVLAHRPVAADLLRPASSCKTTPSRPSLPCVQPGLRQPHASPGRPSACPLPSTTPPPLTLPPLALPAPHHRPAVQLLRAPPA